MIALSELAVALGATGLYLLLVFVLGLVAVCSTADDARDHFNRPDESPINVNGSLAVGGSWVGAGGVDDFYVDRNGASATSPQTVEQEARDWPSRPAGRCYQRGPVLGLRCERELGHDGLHAGSPRPLPNRAPNVTVTWDRSAA